MQYITIHPFDWVIFLFSLVYGTKKNNNSKMDAVCWFYYYLRKKIQNPGAKKELNFTHSFSISPKVIYFFQQISHTHSICIPECVLVNETCFYNFALALIHIYLSSMMIHRMIMNAGTAWWNVKKICLLFRSFVRSFSEWITILLSMNILIYIKSD